MNDPQVETKQTLVTSIEEVRARAFQIVELPGWEPGETFNARLRRASLLALVQAGAIPNDLLPIVHKIMNSGGSFNPVKDASLDEFKQFTEMINAVCKAVLVEPSYEEIGDLLTDVQRTAIFLYAQQGNAALRLFREQQDSLVTLGGHGKGVRSASK